MVNVQNDRYDTTDTVMDIGANERTRVDNVSAAITYIGIPLRDDTLESDPFWRIQRVGTAGTVQRMEWADGAKDFTKEWDDRATYTYATT